MKENMLNKTEFMQEYAQLSSKDLAKKLGVTPRTILRRAKSFGVTKAECVKACNRDKIHNITTKEKHPRKFVITSAQACATPNTNLLKSFDHYCNQNDARLIVLPMIGQSASEDIDQLHRVFLDYELENGTRKLNNNVSITQFNVRPYQIDPITGLNRFAQNGTTMIFASPKQRMKPIPHSNHKSPKYLVTTGACTLPNYASGMDVSAERRRLGNIALRDHVFGALIVEVENDKFFHMRHVRSNRSGKFIDLGKQYDKQGNVSSSVLEAMVCGDWHVGFTDPKIVNGTYDMIKQLKPKRIILHDFFNGASVSHHGAQKPYSENMLQVIDRGLGSLDHELKLCYDQLIELSKLSDAEIFLVSSNHHAFLTRYLDEGRFLKDLTNVRTSVKLLDYMLERDYNDPIEAGIRMQGNLPLNVQFLKLDEDLRIKGYQLACHGDRGASGARGSIKSAENSFGKSISGHVHSAQILRDTYIVGTMLPNNMYYTRGFASSWTNTHGLLWDDGSVQLTSFHDGKWRKK